MENFENDFTFDIEKFTRPTDEYFSKWVEEVKYDVNNQGDVVKKFTDYFLPREGERQKDIEIHIAGKGRSGIVGRYASVRLVNAGYPVYNEFDELTPRIDREEQGKRIILYAISGSGTTEPVFNAAEVAEKNNIPILAITSNENPDSPLAQKATEKIVLRSRTKDSIENEETLGLILEPVGYLGSEFEFKALIASELIVNYLYKRLKITEKEAKEGHKKIEV